MMAANDSTARARHAAHSRAYYYATKDSITPEQRAKKSDYHKAWRESNKDRLRAESVERGKEYREANRDKIKASRDANREKMKAYLIEYHKANKEKHDATMRAHYVANAEAYKARAREWKVKNPDRFKEIRANAYIANRDKVLEKSRLSWKKHNAKRKAKKAEYRKKFPELGAHHCRLRQTRKQKATPAAWADLTAIKAVYKQAAELRKQTGTKWHVDHEIPLKHPLVSGLHVPANLQVIPGAENQSKGNAFIV